MLKQTTALFFFQSCMDVDFALPIKIQIDVSKMDLFVFAGFHQFY